MAALSPSSSVSKEPFSCTSLVKPTDSKSLSLRTQKILDPKEKLGVTEHARLRLCAVSNKSGLKLKASKEPPALTKELKTDRIESPPVTKDDRALFDKMKQRFMSFKQNTYMKNLEHFENLSKGQAPKFMVIACADSRVCPSNILGFQPGEAFVVRNVANMVPSYESGPSETNAALEFAVNSLKVENILVIGHSCCGGIRALMSMHDDVETSSFIGSWVAVGMNARVRTKGAASNLSFDRQCRHCEKESVNCSLANLLTYPWIEEKVRNGELSIHGGYYDFVDCAFEKWTLDYKASNLKGESGKIAVKNRAFWC
ncbi:beta carbonic anhydrase 5, chloroplastic [Ricinus communis]|uniref:Carbonic anhydrase n=1 Tax=Ricinus communis TaxID=3988 RepID=B9S9I2_RICCO|nr:beta carbonic anhydrase 5, chloroplastic [Ricinus communis]EEF39738.1 carbonic anhydrase, putative [Ricinus communis]|eukprot:XP_002522651.1 beta carbonic anhydrase 5, chloroplastic [Ricinus communis]